MAKTMKWMVALAGLTAGCAGMVGAPPATGSTDDEVAASSNALELQGSWRTFCNAGQDGGSFARELTVEGDHLTYLQFEHSDARCGALSLVITLETQLRVGKALTRSSSARQLDERIISSTVSVLTEHAAAQMNESAMCGQTDWHAGQSRAVSPCAIAAGTSVGEGDTVHAVYLRPSDSELRLTDGSQGPVLSLAMDASRRPTAASDDAASVYYKEKPATE